MNDRQLKYFVEVAKAGSLSRAAERLHIAQSALSQQMRTLEHNLGVSLFLRTGRGVRLTDSGALLLEHAQLIMRQLERAREEIQEIGESPRGRVSVGMPGSVNNILTVPFVEEIRQQSPNISLYVVEGLSAFLHEWVCSGRLDIVFLYNAQAEKGLSIENILREQLYFIAPPDVISCEDNEVSFSKVASYPLILPSEAHPTRILIDTYARRYGYTLKVETELDTLVQINRLVMKGLGCSILAQSSVYQELDEGKIRAAPIIDPKMTRVLSIATTQHRLSSRACSDVASTAIRVIRRLVKEGTWWAKFAD